MDNGGGDYLTRGVRSRERGKMLAAAFFLSLSLSLSVFDSAAEFREKRILRAWIFPLAPRNEIIRIEASCRDVSENKFLLRRITT